MLDAIKLHVDAKRYLCQVDRGYYDRLSADSKRSLALQGGVFDAAAAAAFLAQPGARDAVMLRQWDDLAKQADLATPSLAHFLDRADGLRPVRRLRRDDARAQLAGRRARSCSAPSSTRRGTR